MSKTEKKYLPKWRLSKYYHDKYWAERDAKRKEEELSPKPIHTCKLSEEQSMLLKEDFIEGRKLGTTTMADWEYDRHLISYDEYLKRKKNAR